MRSFFNARTCVSAVVLGMVLFVFNQQSSAQDVNASLEGTVQDPTGADTRSQDDTHHEATGAQLNFATDAAGEYNFRNLSPGIYDLAVTASSFESFVRKGIELAVNQNARIPVALTLGNASQTVTVSADASLINYETPTRSLGVAPETIQNLPLVISGAPRSSVTVAIFSPGVTTGGGGNAYNSRTNGGIITGDEAVVDGATAAEGFMNQSGMVSLQTDFGMSPDITSEVKILGSNYDAQYGNPPPASLSSRPGAVASHSTAPPTSISAMTPSTPSSMAPSKTPDKENDFGARVGGPIWIPGYHSRTDLVKGYFFFNWEGFQDHGGATSSTYSIASAAARAGNFSGAGSQLYYPFDAAKYGALAGQPIPNNQIDPNFEDPIAKVFLSKLPTPTNGQEVNNYFVPRSGQGSLTNSENMYFFRIDVNVGQADHFYYTFWWQFSGVNAQTDLPIAISTATPANPENAPIQRFNWEHNLPA